MDFNYIAKIMNSAFPFILTTTFLLFFSLYSVLLFKPKYEYTIEIFWIIMTALFMIMIVINMNSKLIYGGDAKYNFLWPLIPLMGAKAKMEMLPFYVIIIIGLIMNITAFSLIVNQKSENYQIKQNKVNIKHGVFFNTLLLIILTFCITIVNGNGTPLLQYIANLEGIRKCCGYDNNETVELPTIVLNIIGSFVIITSTLTVYLASMTTGQKTDG